MSGPKYKPRPGVSLAREDAEMRAITAITRLFVTLSAPYKAKVSTALRTAAALANDHNAFNPKTGNDLNV